MELDKFLENFREQIDTIDHEIIYLLSRRFALVKQIWNIKKELNISALQEKRWEQLMNNLLEEAKERNVNSDLVTKIWKLIHEESLKIEK